MFYVTSFRVTKNVFSVSTFVPLANDQNLHARMERMLANTRSLYTDMTWGAGGSTAELSLELALYAHKTGHVCT